MDERIYERISEWLDHGASLGEVEARIRHRAEAGDEDARSARWLEDRFGWDKPPGDAAERLADGDRRAFG